MNANAKEKTAQSAGSLLRSYTPILYLVIFVTVAGLFVPNFASKANFLNILKQSAVPIIAAVIGGTSLMGAEVNIVCCVAGAIIIKCIESCINILNLNYYMYQAILGVVILAALVADGLKNRMK